MGLIEVTQEGVEGVRLAIKIPDGWQRVANPHPGAWFHADGMAVCASWDRDVDGISWLHVSVSRPSRLPSWNDLKRVKRDFIGDDKTALQVLPPADQWVNKHNFTLHLWHPIDQDRVPYLLRDADLSHR